MGGLLSITNNLFLEQSEMFSAVYKNAKKNDTETFNPVSITSIDDWYNSILTNYDCINDVQLANLHAFFKELKSVLSQIDPNKLDIKNDIVEDTDLMLWRESHYGISKLIFDEFGQIVYIFNGNHGEKIKGVFESNVDLEKLLYRFISK